MKKLAQFAPSALKLEIIDTPEGLESFAAEWEDLYQRTPRATPYFCYDWVTAMAMSNPLRCFVPRICAVYDAEGLLAVLPFTRRYEGPACGPVLKLLTGGWAPRVSAVVADRAGERPLIAETLNRLRRIDSFWLGCRLWAVPADSPLLPRAEASLQMGFRVERRSIGRSMVIELPGNWEDYCKTVSPKFAREIRAHVRAMSRDMDLHMVRLGLEPLAAPSPELEQLVEDSLAVSRTSWQGVAACGTAASHPGVQECFREVCRRLAARGRLDLSVLYAGPRPISFIWGAARYPGTSIAKSGFDPEFKRYSPGAVHLAFLLRDSIARGLTEIDLGHEFPEHKRRWTRRSDELFEVWWWPRGLPRLVYWGRRALQAGKGSIRQWRWRRPARPPGEMGQPAAEATLLTGAGVTENPTGPGDQAGL